MSMTKIAVVGIGYVGLSNAVLLAQHNDVTAVDLNADRVAQVNARHAPIVDRPPPRSPRRWRKSPSVPDEDVAYDVEEEEYVKIPVALFKNLSKYFACAKPDFVEQARPPDDEERVIVG